MQWGGRRICSGVGGAYAAGWEARAHRLPEKVEGGEEAGLAASHVVLLAVRRQRRRALPPHLQQADRKQDLRTPTHSRTPHAAPLHSINAPRHTAGGGVGAEVPRNRGGAAQSRALPRATERWRAVRWRAVRWRAVRWRAVRWGAVRWRAVRWRAVRWRRRGCVIRRVHAPAACRRSARHPTARRDCPRPRWRRARCRWRCPTGSRRSTGRRSPRTPPSRRGRA